MLLTPGGAFFLFGIGLSTSSWFELGGPPQFPVGPELGLGPGKPPLFAPGAKYNYSNTNWFLLGLVKTAATESRTIRSAPLGFLMM